MEELYFATYLLVNFCMSIIEVELKILDIDLPQLIVSLEQSWATRIAENTIFDVYYEKEGEGSLKDEKKWVRVRYKDGKKIVTLKKRLTTSKDQVKQAVEEEYDLRGWCEHRLMSEYWLAPSWLKYKRRITYTHGNVQFDIDLYPWIPPILEIEAENKEIILHRVKKLWLQKKDQSVSWTRGLFKRYSKKPVPIVW